MRILQVTDWNRGRGGAEAYALWLRQSLRAEGHDARLLTSSAGSAADGTADFVALGSEQIVAQTFLQIFNPFAFATVRRALQAFEPDVTCVNMFAHHLSPAVLQALGNTPLVLLVSDYKCICPIGSKLLPDGSLCHVQAGWVCSRAGCVSLPHWVRDQVRYAYLHSAMRGVCRVLACSAWVQGELTQAGISSEVLHWPVPSPAAAFVRTPCEHPVFLFCGRLDVEKGGALMLRAFARLHAENQAVHLRVVGQGPERANLERLAASLGVGDAVVFLGWLSPPEIEQHLRDAWCSLVPSLWAEPFGLVAVEAIVHGVPVIASSSGGLREIVEHGVSGMLFPNNDEAALTDCLRAIAHGRMFPIHTLPDEVIQRAMETFSMKRHISRLRQIFAEVVEQGPSSRS
jgi:glycosyltransferase involved in cell wall biosynthesis